MKSGRHRHGVAGGRGGSRGYQTQTPLAAQIFTFMGGLGLARFGGRHFGLVLAFWIAPFRETATTEPYG